LALAFEFSNILMDFNEYLMRNILTGLMVARIAVGHMPEPGLIAFKKLIKRPFFAFLKTLDQL